MIASTWRILQEMGRRARTLRVYVERERWHRPLLYSNQTARPWRVWREGWASRGWLALWVGPVYIEAFWRTPKSDCDDLWWAASPFRPPWYWLWGEAPTPDCVTSWQNRQR
jgi:hypothetical protein